MDLTYSPEEEAFRVRVRQWIADHAPARTAVRDLQAARAWQRALHDAGFLGVGWPAQYGGATLTKVEQAILNEELARANAPGVVNIMAIWWVGPAIMKYGTEEQQRRFLPRILDAEEIWATGYSEPGSGSDMAAAKTRADRQGDYYVVSGQKVWTTIAHISDWYFVLVRTSSEGPKWAGLTVLLMDLKSPGVEVRPIRQITGDSEFNEVFMHEVKVPVSNRLGAEGQGWEIVSSALINERSGIAGSIRADQSLARLVALARQRRLTGVPHWRQRLSDLAIRAQILRAAGYQAMTDDLRGRRNPHLSAGMKLLSTELTQKFSETGVEMLGVDGLLWDDDAPDAGRMAYQFLADRSSTIAGGTSEVQRNIVAQRVLGLPRR
ncbi:acyl-CoA dehydrogenase family protein [bacterium]|nr:acyl-CoA dehydrogenase family protein [bacterium]